MAENFSFFDPVEVAPGVWDREYFAQQFTDYFRRLVTTGVMKGESGELKVSTEGNSMITTLNTGVAYVVGRSYENTIPLSHTHDTEVLGKNRIDRIVVRLDLRTESRFVKSFIKKGVASTIPVPPDLQRDQFIYEISLAQVKIIGGQTYINANDVIDERGKTDICPWAGSKILPNFDDATLEAHIHDYLEHIPFAITNTDTNDTRRGRYVINLDNLTDYYDGLAVAIKIHEENIDTFATLNINGIGQKVVIKPNGDSVNASEFKKNAIYTLRYNGQNFVLQGGINQKIPDASTTEKGIVKLTNDITSLSETTAPTSNALWQIYNKVSGNKFVVGGANPANSASNEVIAVGAGSVAKNIRDVALGSNSTARGGDSIAIGKDTISGADYSGGGSGIAIGYQALANGVNTIAIGANSKANTHYTTAIGLYANALNERDLVLGTSIDNVKIYGNLSVSKTKNFESPHPKPEKQHTHVIRHGAVESPTTGDTLYRYSIKIENNKAFATLFGENNEIELPITEKDEVYLLSIPLPDYFIYLNTNEQVFVNADKHFGLGFGEINRDTETLELTLNSLKDYNVMLLGTRNDDGVQDWYIKGVEREVGEGWEGQTHLFEFTEIEETAEFEEVFV
ncbi:tail fiber protein [Heyndrickxia oleronia]|uniref:tail fiber protein n=1 Tax=Heyndrickxia oleronia TaxID=38875 RepID=UPI001C0EBB99|nr:tail fiber protein [Heyndrickxia oleronia]MBU5215082.1 tail fiber protein [Heyndrickxia oleronia]